MMKIKDILVKGMLLEQHSFLIRRMILNTGEYRYVWKAIKYPRKYGEEIIDTVAYIIGVQDMVSKEVNPHPLTHFLYKYYHRHSGSVNTELNAAQVIVAFMNFVLEKVHERDTKYKGVIGLEDLLVTHANDYLQYCVDDKVNKKKTLEIKENYLSKFYSYLWQEKVLKKKPSFKVVTIRSHKEIKTIDKIDFLYKKTDETLLREKVKRKDIVPQSYQSNSNRMTIRLKNIREILLLAKYEVPDIAFGVALQMFGGLRRGELINLNRTALKPQNGLEYGVGGLVIEIRDRQIELFSRFVSVASLQVKNPRDQSCLIDSVLNYLYKNHIENVLPKIKKMQNENALFYDSEGNAMSAETYDKRFLKLKNTYLGMLLATKGRYQDYLDFSQTKWRSHIGRGVFTNMCLDAGFNEKQTAVLRGDKSIQSMESYFDIVTATSNIRNALELIQPESKEMLGVTLHSNHDIKMWEDVLKIGKGFR